MALYYLDASALVKRVLAEPESPALDAFVEDADLLSCDLVLAEAPRAVRAAAARFGLPLDEFLARALEVSEQLALLPLDEGLLAAAGAIAEPALRTLDAIHVAAALELAPIDGFVSYDERQSAAARLVGLRTFAPGA